MMSWNRYYHFYLLFGDTVQQQEPWKKTIWLQQIQPAMDKVLRYSPHYKKTGLGTIQYIPKPDTAYFQTAKFGKLAWNSDSHEKWTITSEELHRRFHHLDIWTPSRGVCEKLGASPDIYFSMCNTPEAYHRSITGFDLFAVIAVAEDLQTDPTQEILELSRALHAKKTVYSKRSWDQKAAGGNWHFINSIQDTMSATIYKTPTGDLHDAAFEDIAFTPFWEIVYETQNTFK